MTDEPRIIEEKITARGAGPRGAASDIAAVPAPTETPRPAAAAPPAPVAAPAPKNDFAKILQEVKLPDRRSVGADGPKQPAGTMPPVPKEQAPAFGALPTYKPNPADNDVNAPTGGHAEAANVAAVLQYRGVGQGAPAAIAPAAPPSPEAAQKEGGAASPIASLHTMKTDLQDVVRDRKISVVRAVSMEQDRPRQRSSAPIEIPRSHAWRTVGLLATAALLLAALGGAAIYATSILTGGGAPPMPVAPAILFAENKTAFPMDNQPPSALRQALGATLSQEGSVGTITQVVPTLAAAGAQAARAATLEEFLAALGAHPPADLMRALSSDFFFGVHMADVPSPVFVIPVISYDRAFAGMLAWEASIDTDLSPLFKLIPAVTAAPGGGLPVERQFKDLVVRNYDVRGLEDDSGAVVLYYSFPTPDLLVIAASPYTFPEVLSRLQAERKL